MRAASGEGRAANMHRFLLAGLSFLSLSTLDARRSPLAAQEETTVRPPKAVFRARAVDTLGSRARTPASLDTATQQFDVGGVRVILRNNTASDVVAANVYLLGGTQQVTQRTAGIEPFLLSVAERGTRRYAKDALRRTLARLGSSVEIDATQDWTLLGLRTLRDAFDSSWTAFADQLVAPVLDSADVEQVREQYLAAAQQRRSDPDALVALVADSVRFGDHPYAIDPRGTEQSIGGITRAQLRAYHASHVVKSRMLVVVVGNVDRRRVERLVRATLATLPAGSYEWALPAIPAPAPAGAVLLSRPLPTNYILGYYVGPAASSRDYAALRIASAVLAGSLFSEIRSRRNLTYAVDAPFLERAVATGGVYVTTVAPDTTLALMRGELAMLQTELLDPLALRRLVQRFITDYFLKNETNADQATFLARSALYLGDYREASRFVDALHRVTPEDLQRVARTYMKDFRFAYVGDTTRVRRASLERF
jgi:zinc protease